jgi:hypothetical protein
MLKKFLPAIVAVLLFFVAAALYFAPQFGGDVLPQHDVKQYEGSSHEIYQSRDTYGEDPQWIGSMFGGMPAYLVNVQYPAQWVKLSIGRVVRVVDTPAGFLFFAMCAMWAMLLMMGIEQRVAILPAMAYGLSTYFILIIGAGHITKMWALVYAPLVMGSIYLTLRTPHRWWGGVLTALFLSLEIGANHPQITYYFVLAATFFWLSEAVVAWRARLVRAFVGRTAILLVAGVVALGSNFAPLWYTMQHTKDTIRGGSELASAAQPEKSGLDLDYATAWSYGRAESWNMLIPNFMGGDSSNSFARDGAVAAALRPYGMQSAAQQLPTYWGDQPYTGGPTYLGAVVVLLAVMGLLLAPPRERWWILGATLFMLALSWGRHWMGLTQWAFAWLPGYNKFRTVSMTLVIVQWSVPLLAAIALQRVWKGDVTLPRLRRALAWAVGVTGGICLLFIVAGGALFDFGKEASVAQLTEQFAQLLRANGADDLLRQGLDVTLGEEVGSAMAVERNELMCADAWRSLLFILLTGAALWVATSQLRWRKVAYVAIGLLLVVDLWQVDRRYLSDDNFVSPRRQQWTPTAADQTILRDSTLGFRVLNRTVSPFNDATTSYYHRSVGGYHGAKLARYQDLIDGYLSQEEEQVLDMLNTRYTIDWGADGTPTATLRSSAFGAAWFVSDVIYADSVRQEFDLLHQVDLRKIAVVAMADKDKVRRVESCFAEKLFKERRDTIALVEYRPNYLRYTYTSEQGGLALFSEIFYDKGWCVTVNGEEYPYVRADYLLRAMALPAATEGVVEWRFRAPRWGVVEGITGVASALILLALVAMIVCEIVKKRRDERG